MSHQQLEHFPKSGSRFSDKKCGKTNKLEQSVEPNETKTALDVRRKRLLFRAWHRGMREVDLILGRFADQKITMMNEDELDEFEKILSYEDRDLLGWLSGQVAIPLEVAIPLMQYIVSACENPKDRT